MTKQSLATVRSCKRLPRFARCLFPTAFYLLHPCSRRNDGFVALLLLFLTTGIYAAEYIGGPVCTECHAEESKAWQGSHHDLAMQTANAKTVLGDFNNVSFVQFGVESRFFRKGDQFWVNTDGPDGKLQDYQISYTFGVTPLQQYLIKFPGGRLQVLDIAWDSREQQQGGQRWFHLHPEDKVAHDDVLHWTGPNLNWNYMCADCHSTNLLKNYSAKTESYSTNWSEMNVSCEACHGPGSAHKKWADVVATSIESKVANKGLTAKLTERQNVSWHTDKKTGKPKRSVPNADRAEIQVCARCHSRRSQLSDDFVPGQAFMDAYHPSLLSDGLYYADGQMADEVYVWGSFRQSKMYAAGVTCSDCHDPHKADLKVPGEQVCYQCHAETRYASKQHHKHQPDDSGSACVACHMPATTFMGVDDRHDHGFRIPRPDQSAVLGTPNACTQCHDDKTPAWATKQLDTWYGHQPKGYQRYAPVLAAARLGMAGANTLLLKLAMDTDQAGIARATALSELGGQVDRNSMMLIQQALNDDDPLVRQGALVALESVPEQQRILGFPLVWDDILSVRIQAARLMAAYPGYKFSEEQQQMQDAVLEEYIQAQKFNAERPESQLNLASLYTDLEQWIKAEQAFRKALQLQPMFVPGYINFSHMLSGRGRETEAATLLKVGIQRLPASADMHHALGLSAVRQKDIDAAIPSLARAAALDRRNTRYQYVYAVALQSVGKLDQAIEVLIGAHSANIADLDILSALVTFNREAESWATALSYAKKLKALLPGNADIEKLIAALEIKARG